MLYIENNLKNTNINPCKIANFSKFKKIYTPENIYLHSIQTKKLQFFTQNKNLDVRQI